ncbi:MAG: universal stress protein [Opitutales bacterium]|nr:universal stress protein [Opitutales bacterium]MCH8541610.1 universal stress protein [Opitutales bacterium]
MNKIISCTDGSIYAPSIYDHSAWVAKRTGAKIHVMHMLDPNLSKHNQADLSGNFGLDAGDDLLDEMVQFEETKNRIARERGKAILQAARKHLEDLEITEVKTEQQIGSLIETVAKLEKNADLVVIGKRGESADFATGHLGSNLERIIRASANPVLVAARSFKPINAFALAYDGGPSTEKALHFALQQPLLKGLTCHLIRAGNLDDKAKWYLEEAAEKLRQAGYSVHVRAIPGEPEKAIAETIKKEKIQLLVMGAYGHSRIRQFIVGSTTTAMIRSCLVPVLMFR